MFGLFKKKNQGATVTDFVTISETAKWHNLLDKWKANPQLIFICWFEETYDKTVSYFSQNEADTGTILLAREAASHHLHNKTVLFTEHHPSKIKEDELYEKLNLQTVTVWSSLDEPIFEAFGGGRIIELMKKLGVGENEPIQHQMISNAIANAQHKIEKKRVTELSARSQKEWIEKN
ncbi:MAG: hypothetical protein IPM85_08405 [Chitinophagaceae bacterium]|nr:hypothetical protein [Chitinophagaceae bacterium]